MNLSNCKEKHQNLLFANFNQDYSCFACGTEKGFLIFSCDPFKERFGRVFDGGVGIVEMLFRCNILAIVGGGKKPKYTPNQVMIWDDYQNKCIAKLEFKSEVKAVKLRRDRIVVVLENKVYVYNFSDLQLVHQLETTNNPKGICAVCPGTANVLACPGLKPGYVHVELYDHKQTQIIPAHESALSQIALNKNGTRLATASEKGTLIRIFDTATGEKIKEVRRGTNRAEIYSIAFNNDSTALCVSSDKNTGHIFDLSSPNVTTPSPTDESNQNRQSSFSFMGDLLPTKYFKSEWSAVQFQIPESRSICAFGSSQNSINVICASGICYKYTYDFSKGECKRDDNPHQFMENEES
ncbi:WD repeat domain phosphoinositide-interacting protein 3 [Tieghemostelium lacteum]|uniref:WD repeat domain phosphoinositide-interacting protein 3 n=1 Tax=Tieghemostelium lacteum TaxID=361077 RepID=A0A152A5U9_TIELA|nr:WD repeat domain phosphoinositide-interacting protein 3 [Tieghemostelium lacteum]|eukprot:KYR01471.1 WD repeat domain phosphoinositide-interacting protein 3 [Tieghemostelium lacteum]